VLQENVSLIPDRAEIQRDLEYMTARWGELGQKAKFEVRAFKEHASPQIGKFNHDWIGEKAPHLSPKLRWHMLCDESINLLGFKIYGTPWQPRFFDWAFNADEDVLEKKWAAIPDDTDILVLHGPPYGFGDLAPAYTGVRNEMERTGSPSLIKRIREIKPQLAIFGHIHPGYGVYEENGVVMANVSVLNDKYQLVNKPYRTTLEPRTK
jgi:hypothetical protein